MAHEAQGKEPPCDECKALPPEPLFPENEEAFSIYRMIANQFVYDFHCTDLVLASFGYEPWMRRTRELIKKLILIHAVRNEKEKK